MNILFENQVIAWLYNIIAISVLPVEIKAIYFGIFESETWYVLYMIGSKEFDANSNDWACNNDFEPSEKYLAISIREINQLEWSRFLDQVKNILKYLIMNDQQISDFFVHISHVAVGFDDGDLHYLK